MNCPRWLPSTVARSQTPGRTLLRPPEKPAKKCGSMKPSATSSSVSAASLSMTSGVPEGRRPISTFAPRVPAVVDDDLALGEELRPELGLQFRGRRRPVEARGD